MKSRAHTFSKSAPEGEKVRHDGRTVFLKVRPCQFFCAICPMAQPKCIPAIVSQMLTDGQTDGQTDRRTEWGIAIALSQIGWLGAKNYSNEIAMSERCGKSY